MFSGIGMRILLGLSACLKFLAVADRMLDGDDQSAQAQQDKRRADGEEYVADSAGKQGERLEEQEQSADTEGGNGGKHAEYCRPDYDEDGAEYGLSLIHIEMCIRDSLRPWKRQPPAAPRDPG